MTRPPSLLGLFPLRLFPLGLALAAAPLAVAGAASLAVNKSSMVVSDQVNALNPRALPGAQIDYSLVVTNPVTNALQPVRGVVIEDPIPANVALRIADLGAAGSGPVEFVDGTLLGLDLTGSGLSYTFAGYASTTDSVQFYDGTSWNYLPVSTGGFDANVRAIRVTLTGTQKAGTSFRLRYRVRLK